MMASLGDESDEPVDGEWVRAEGERVVKGIARG